MHHELCVCGGGAVHTGVGGCVTIVEAGCTPTASRAAWVRCTAGASAVHHGGWVRHQLWALGVHTGCVTSSRASRAASALHHKRPPPLYGTRRHALYLAERK